MTETPKVKPFDIGCEPSPSVPAETLIQDGWRTFLLFFAVSKSGDENGRLKDLRVAVLECEGCVSTNFGYPNDEGLPEHPYYNQGLSDVTTDVVEVVDSPWRAEVEGQMDDSAKRIWGGRGVAVPTSEAAQLRHFIVTLKEATFECSAKNLRVVKFAEDFEEAFSYVSGKLAEH